MSSMIRRALWLVSGGILSTVVWADLQTTSAPVSSPTQAVSASARLDFNLNIGKFIFFRVGTGAYPTASSTVDTVSLNVVPLVPGTPANGNGAALAWNGSASPFASIASAVLPVEVRSNAGQVSIRAAVSVPLSNGSQTLPMSDISVVSSDTNLPAPPIPSSGMGSSVNIVGTSFANLVTQRSANWTFSYTGSTAPVAGAYSGQITFTASAP